MSQSGRPNLGSNRIFGESIEDANFRDLYQAIAQMIEHNAKGIEERTEQQLQQYFDRQRHCVWREWMESYWSHGHWGLHYHPYRLLHAGLLPRDPVLSWRGKGFFRLNRLGILSSLPALWSGSPILMRNMPPLPLASLGKALCTFEIGVIKREEQAAPISLLWGGLQTLFLELDSLIPLGGIQHHESL